MEVTDLQSLDHLLGECSHVVGTKLVPRLELALLELHGGRNHLEDKVQTVSLCVQATSQLAGYPEEVVRQSALPEELHQPCEVTAALFLIVEGVQHDEPEAVNVAHFAVGYQAPDPLVEQRRNKKRHSR